ncbi:ATP-binding protein [uncultured Parvibaculum sp.]|uniref:ATP-binding response regulator n=1 Tax=uncultured Parvibaculum sp. TaxID=291828 RepID=UPI0030D78E99
MTVHEPPRAPAAPFRSALLALFGIDPGNEANWRLFTDRVDLLYQQALPGLIVHAVVITATTYSMSLAPNAGDEVFVWGGVMIVLGLLRMATILYFRKSPALTVDPLGSLLSFYVVIGLTGIGWGIGGVFILPADALPQQIFFIMMLSGTAAGTVATLAPFLSAQILALGTSVVPLMIRFALEGGSDQLLMSGALLMFTLAMVATGRNTHLAIVNGLRLRQENLDLLEDLRKKSEALELSSRAKTRFLAAASHDLRQPLHALRLQSESLAIRAGSDPRIQSVTDRIGRSVGAMERLLNSLLDISRLDAGVVEPHIATFRIDSVLRTLEDEFRAAAAAAGCDLRIVSCSTAVSTDATLLETILRNLMSNALRHAPGAKILVGCLHRDDRLRLIVMDDGEGIPAGQKDRVFEEFFQMDNPARDRNKGLGLGLSIVKRLTDLLELPLHFSSREGRGTSFSVDIPVGEEIITPSTAPRFTAPAKRDQRARNGCRVWVIDDDEQGRVSLADVIESWGYKPEAAAEFRTLLEDAEVSGVPPSALLVDYRLKGSENGLVAIREIRRFFGITDLPAIIVTGDTASERLKELKSSGIHILHKPIAPGRLRTLLATLMKESDTLFLKYASHVENRS